MRLDEGWEARGLGARRRVHYFRDGRSLCGRWTRRVRGAGIRQRGRLVTYASDCKVCAGRIRAEWAEMEAQDDGE